MIIGTDVCKNYALPTASSQGLQTLRVLKNLNFKIEAQSWTTLMGPSGSGKSTLLSLLAGLDTVSQGSIQIDGTFLENLNEEERAKFRADKMGFIFQSFRLLPTLTALENVLLPLEILGQFDKSERGILLLKKVGLENRLDHLPSQLSGGEQQRVAVARAFAAQPKILFADEPTGNLDSKNGNVVLDLLNQLRIENNSTLVVVTHDPEVAKHGDKTLQLRDGEWV